jgi:biopolymer transport protein ExbD
MMESTIFQVKRKKPVVAGLMLVSLVDIFTFFIIFLLINSGESPKIQNARFVALPSSTSNTEPRNKILVYIDAQQVWLDDKPVANVADILNAPEKLIAPLTVALMSRKETIGELSDYEKVNGLSITIMGDKSVPYKVLKSVMVTCQGSDYRNIALAVNHVLPGTSGSLKSDDSKDSGAAKVGG